MLKTWALSTVGLLAFAVLVWFAGPLLVIAGEAPLASPAVRLLVVAAFVLQYLAQKLWSLRQGRRNNERLVSGLTPAAQPGLSAEQTQLSRRFADALSELRRMRFGPAAKRAQPWTFGRSYLYQLPWYVIIGAPGAGKTTALLNSGLDFPLAKKLGRGSVQGFGGTRNCDWWFTDRAVLIDTAGRYTTQDSDRLADRLAWESFLQLLRRSRPRRPLNGVLIAVSADDLLGFNPAELNTHANLLRARLDELQSALQLRVPVYLLITKCDLLPGFVDWFDALERKDRDQVWGVTFDLRAADSGAAAGEFSHSFERLLERLGDDLVGRLHSERDAQRRTRILAFLRQLHGLTESLDTLVRRAFGSPGQAAGAAGILLRGVYLTSATQQGTPIDRMLSAFGRELGLEQQILPPNQSSGRSFFLSGLLNGVVFAEAGLSGQTPLRQRWQRRMLAASIVLLQLCAVLIAAWWVSGYFRTVEHIDRLDAEVAKVKSVVGTMPSHVDPDPRAILPALDAAGALAQQRVPPVGRIELVDLGSRSRLKLGAAARDAYDRLLLGPFQRQIAAAIDATLRTGSDINVQYEALKTYAMLNDAAHFDADGLRVFVMSYWDSALAPPLSAAERQELTGHLNALVAAGAVESGVKVERALVESVQARLKTESVPQRIGLRVGVLLELHPYADFSVASAVPAAAALFVGADGSAAPKPVPGRYTLDAYRNVVDKEVPAIAAQLSAESTWVLGATQVSAAADAAAYLGSYRADYAQAWTRLLDDLHLKSAANDQEAVRQAQLLGSSDGPLLTLLEAIAHQTPVRLENGSAGPIGRSDPSAERLVALTALVSGDAAGITRLEEVTKSFRELQALRSPGSPPGQFPGTPQARLARLIAGAQGEPEPVRGMLLALAVLPPPSTATPVSGAAALSRQIAARLALPCLRLVGGKFPFDRRADQDAPLADFARLFAPKGAFDEVFQQLLASHVDTSSDSWKALSPAGPDVQDMEIFRSAARIRDVMFANGSPEPALQLTFRPLDLDEGIDRFELKVDGQSVRYAHGPLLPTVVKWPGPQGAARIEVSPATADPPVEYHGPWALFRLLDHAAIQETGTPGHFHVVFDLGGRRASFEVESSGGANPFRLRELERFNCPMARQ